MIRTTGVFATLVLLAAGSLAQAQLTPEDLAGEAAVLALLEQGEVVEAERMSASEGVTEPFKLTIKNADMEGHALWKNPSGRVKGFWEGWQYEIAAFRLDRHLGLNMVPATVERRHEGNRGSCQEWVDFWITMRDKAAQNASPTGGKVNSWNSAVYLQRAFDNLIANEDRHLGNILITKDWRMILIDHSRSFRSTKKHTTKLLFDAKTKAGPKLMKRLPRAFVDKIKALDAATLREVVGDTLTDKEIAAVIARKGLILADIDTQIAQNGEAKVLY